MAREDTLTWRDLIDAVAEELAARTPNPPPEATVLRRWLADELEHMYTLEHRRRKEWDEAHRRLWAVARGQDPQSLA